MRADRFGSRPRRVGHEVRVLAPVALAGEAAGILAAAAAGPVARRPAPPGPGGGARVLLEAALDPGEGGDALIPGLEEAFERLERAHAGAALEVEREERLVEEDAGAVHRERFAPLLAAPGLVVRPPWRECTPAAGDRVLVIDPGASFGSGTHASTRLALGLVAERCAAATPPRRVLDVGTGSGVLALAAALWGAAEVTGVDLAPEAVAAAEANARRNGLAERARFLPGGPAAAPGSYDLVAANLTAEVLVPLARDLAACLAPGGALVLSGILAGGQDAEVLAAVARAGLACVARRGEGEWVALLAERAPGLSPGDGEGPGAVSPRASGGP